MNIDIKNIGHFRITSHGGRSYDLFNREKDTVKRITSGQYASLVKMTVEQIDKLDQHL